MRIGVLGAGAFGTALAITLGQKHTISLWARDQQHADDIASHRENTQRLPGCPLPNTISPTADLATAVEPDILLVTIPMQKLRQFLEQASEKLTGKSIVLCCKGVELATGMGPQNVAADVVPGARISLLTGPSFAQDIARGLPTALTLACANVEEGAQLQEILSTDTLRLYRTTDITGAALGGALKNVVAIAAGVAIGAGLGESARAALMTRGNAEMQRFAAFKGADPATLSGLSGFGDLVLTCTSAQSRNYRLGLSLGAGTEFDPKTTVEGAATAIALAEEAQKHGLDLPIASAVAGLVENRLDVARAMSELLSRSLKEE